MSDRDSQPTAKAYMEAAKSLGFLQIFSGYYNPKGNADTERVIRTIKEDLVWPRDWSSLGELESALGEWVGERDTVYLHLGLGYDTPMEYARWFNAAVVNE